ncbi:chromosome segregation protein SMC [Rhodopirellula sp. MGV]|uniref:chromosome segregation protein SMC n=1 Tax=Rhodopirellula sp. MGV TaxID=2023130 RepID=UPI000B97BCEB|nr:chromosome segregation protein SMC [Rhodopirellula sp. MGV]OYP32341.1 chromosome segregation protein SMC [Rhodopirellula sp. MGV]PNY35876.1 chromosome segregation protein SMC [Rhodopirellula baltica]
MLKALELAGFKSFADRTRFDFPDGITVVVGPNGSGKSNIVDAMKWVLGSQSPKGLRGKEMSDVIFKGSQTRPPAGAAEATIVFDNSQGNLPIDAPEVHVTRRVYRSGESEFLINGDSVRLKDVRDLIRGTGIGIDAYSLIEQGKVDRMLQANAKDRRAIFEEAAGISRFKAKKLEAERRLARVQTNLTRLSDIVEEVGARLRSVRSQAAKAERYRQASERLKELRTVIAWNDWANLNHEFETCEKELTQASTRLRELEAEREEISAKRQAADMELQTIADEARELEQQRHELLAQAATLSGRKDADQGSVSDVRLSIADALRRSRALVRQARKADDELDQAIADHAKGDQELGEVRQRNTELVAKRDQIQNETDEVLKRRESISKQHLESIRRVSEMEVKLQRSETRLSESERQLVSLEKRLTDSAAMLEKATTESEMAEERLGQLEQRIKTSEAELKVQKKKTDEHREVLDRRSGETAELRARLEGVRQRYLVLEDLVKRHEGVSGGVRAVLEHVADPDHPLATSVIGMVAAMVNVDVETAPMIDAALRDRAQFIVTHDGQLADAIVSGEIKIDSRVGIIRMDHLPEPPRTNRIQLEGFQGVIGRADRVIECEGVGEKLIAHLLSSSWLVEDLDSATLVRRLCGPDQQIVTRRGEVLMGDGSLIVGPAGATTALVSRRSEMNAAAEEIEHYTFEISENDEAIRELAALVDECASTLGRMEISHRNLVTEKAAAEADVRHAKERAKARKSAYDQINNDVESTRQERDTAKQEAGTLSESILESRKVIERLETEAADVEEMLSGSQQALQSASSAVMTASVELARSEQRQEALAAQIESQRREQEERRKSVDSATVTAETGYARQTELKQRIKETVTQLAALTSQTDTQETQLRTLAEKAQSLRQSNRAIAEASEATIKAVAEASEQVHSVTNRRESTMMRRGTLAERIAEDYQIDLENDEPPEELAEIENRSKMDEEINHLREQLQRTSNVNMEALAELEGLQERHDLLSGQYEDLAAAKESLQRIIGRINADSRRLFLDTLEAIRQNFQKLYRKSFGGGHADLVLEESEDPLEAGVEIVATPPGKPSFSNSLLSGGEKALTAVALLMSIFQYRPSPFCVLDEVDAPFDEANIGRFVMVLNEFLDHSKFVIVTHSKKTMTAATTLYGVTMQESGVSKRVSIRFEDVSEDGEITEGEAA